MGAKRTLDSGLSSPPITRKCSSSASVQMWSVRARSQDQGGDLAAASGVREWGQSLFRTIADEWTMAAGKVTVPFGLAPSPALA